MSEKINPVGDFNAKVWALAFLQTTTEHPNITTDKDAILGWFANAIMAGYDQAQHELRAELARRDEELALIKRHFRLPTHGSCCTCQRCGQDYDTCRCTLDDVADENEKLKSELSRRDDIISRLKEVTIKFRKGWVIRDEGRYFKCRYCGAEVLSMTGSETDPFDIPHCVHAPDCPITLHGQLMKEIGGEK